MTSSPFVDREGGPYNEGTTKKGGHMELATFFEGSEFREEGFAVFSSFASGDGVGRSIFLRWKDSNSISHLLGLSTDSGG